MSKEYPFFVKSWKDFFSLQAGFDGAARTRNFRLINTQRAEHPPRVPPITKHKYDARPRNLTGS